MKMPLRPRWKAATFLALVVALLGVSLARMYGAGSVVRRPRGEEGADLAPHPRESTQPTTPPATPSVTAQQTTAGAASGTIALSADPPLNGFLTGTYTAESGGTPMTFYLHVPSPLDPWRLYPLVLLLHGGGERARAAASTAQNRALLLTQPYIEAWTSAALQRQMPCFVIVPQLVAPNTWVNVPPSHGSYSLATAPTPSLADAKGIVDALRDEYASIDASRLYITGISIDAYGVWDAIVRWPGYFAAAAPLAGAGDPSHAAALANLPLWAFEGTDDTVVPVSGSRDMIQAIEAAGGHPRFTEFAGAGHAIWMLVYGTPDFLKWLFDQRNPALATPYPLNGVYGPH